MDDSADKVGEDLRLTYRYLDLRRTSNLDALKLRHETSMAIREFFDNQDFLEIETPMLLKSTPKEPGNSLVPSRLNPGKVLCPSLNPPTIQANANGRRGGTLLSACPLLPGRRPPGRPAAGVHPIDLEMSFIDREDMYALIQGLMKEVWQKTLGEGSRLLLRIPFEEAMNR